MNLPDRDTIHKLLRGELAPEDLGAVFRQLEDDAAFDSIVGALIDDHTFLDLIRNADVLLTQAPNPELDRLVRRFQASGALTAPNGTFAGSGKPPEKPTGTVFRPRAIGGFQILGLLGEGGMGAVFLAEDLYLKRRVALKVMRPEIAAFEESRNRFMLEAQAAARIKHDHVVDIYQVGIDDGAPFIAMPLLEGESLDDRLKRETVSSVAMLLKVGREVAMGLQAAHDKKLIHRDIKPANIWLEGDANPERPESKFRRTKILDFGLARCQDTGVQTTRSGTILGSPLFMAPEQGYGKPTDARSDLFSLGVVLYRMATGEQPFKGGSIMEVLTSLALHVPLAPKATNPDLPDEASNLIVRLMQKDPVERYQTAREVVAEIERIIRTLKAKSQSGTSVASPIPIPKPIEIPKPEPLPSPNPVPERVVESFPPEILPPTGPSLPTPDFDPSAKSRLMLGLGLVVTGLVLLLMVLALAFNDNGPDSGSSSQPTRLATVKVPTGGEATPTRSEPIPTTPILTTPIPTLPKPTLPAKKIDPPVVRVPIAGEEKSIEIAAGVMMEFCWIPAGEAQLGSPKEEKEYLVKTYFKGERPTWLDDENESVRGKYKSKGFWMAKYPVTQGEWRAVMGNSPSKFTGDRLPVEQVSWYDSVEFCNKISAKMGLSVRYKLSEIERNTDGTIKKATVEIEPNAKGPRLPLEDEWEYACRGGLGNGRAFYWGDVLDGDKANCNGNIPYGTETKGSYLGKTSDVGAFESEAKHPWGLCDMSGNAYQWNESLYSEKSSDRVIRGGSWYSDTRNCRSADRDRFDPSVRGHDLGFRLAVPETGK